jgi:ABC-type transport system involved in multi-copper enzyme maturation permease subunit
MAFFLYVWPQMAPWYVSYVVLFNMLVGPVFSAGSVTSERERETLDLLLTTILSSRQILSAKLVSGLRVSSVLTMFLLWPLVLAVVMVNTYWTHLAHVLGYLAIVLVVCVTTATVALFCSVMFHKTSISLMTTYLVIVLLFMAPLAVTYFADTFFPQTPISEAVGRLSFTSPFAAAFHLPIDMSLPGSDPTRADWAFFAAYAGFYVVLDGALLAAMAWLFNVRWRMA